MSYAIVVKKFSILFLINFVFLGINGEVYYVPKFTDSVFSCDDFDNDFLDCDGLKLGSIRGDDGEDAAKLSGEVKTLVELTSDHDIEIDIWKMMDMGDEYMYNTRVNFCASLQQKDAPWYPIIEKLNISACPVAVSNFEVKGMAVSLDAMKDFMCHDMCGEYRIQLSFMDKTTKLSCHILEICVVEVNDEDE